MFSEIIAHNMHQKIRQLYNNITVCELYLVLPGFMKDICLTDVNVYIRSYGTQLFICLSKKRGAPVHPQERYFHIAFFLFLQIPKIIPKGGALKQSAQTALPRTLSQTLSCLTSVVTPLGTSLFTLFKIVTWPLPLVSPCLYTFHKIYYCILCFAFLNLFPLECKAYNRCFDLFNTYFLLNLTLFQT